MPISSPIVGGQDDGSCAAFPSHFQKRQRLRKILRTVIQTGRAIEVNTHGGREVEEWRPILERYRVLGGELVTTGSDAHRPYAVGKGLRQVHSLLWDTGFRWLTLYRGRKPTQVKLR